MSDSKPYLFQVNLKGMIELLSEHIYSAPKVFVRELLQNGIDAVTARKHLDEKYVGQINVYIKPDQVIFEDNGIGLTENEVHQFLAVIGQSSKRNDIDSNDFIGKFGIGLLSCFVVSHQIIVETCSLINKKTVRWTGESDGTYSVDQIDEQRTAGTRVILQPKKEWKTLFEPKELTKNILYFGGALPIKIDLINNNKTKTLVDGAPVWLNPNSSKEDLLACGKEVFNIKFLDAFPLYAATGDIQGVGYIMPYKVQFTANKDHRVFLKRMFLCEDARVLFPEWSSFVKCIINTNQLKPTASRESLMDNDDLKLARKELNNNFKTYLTNLSINNLPVLKDLIKTHHLFIKALAAEDNELLKIFVNFIPFETNKGIISFESLLAYNTEIYYTPSIDDFRQIRRIAGSQGKTIINAAYSFETDLLRKIGLLFPDLILEKVTPKDILSNFAEAQDHDLKYKTFENRANKILKQHYCQAQVRSFEPHDTPVIYVANDEAMNNKNLQGLQNSSNPFASTLQNFIKKEEEYIPTLCFNCNNVLITDLLTLEDDTLFEAVVSILYVQSLMLSSYPLNKKEMTVFNEAIYQLLIMGMNNFSQKLLS